MNNFDIGKKITYILGRLLGDKIFPLVANEGTEFPFCIYRRSNYTPANTKDYIGEIIDVEIVVLSPKYYESIDIAKQVCELLLEYTDNEIDEIQLTNCFETYSDFTFTQQMNFRFIFNN